MKIVFLGASHGVPEPNRKCSSALIEVGEGRYIIDMGTQAIEELITRGISPESIRSVFITHMHGDHTNGLISFLDLCSWKFKSTEPKIYLPGDVERARAVIREWLACNDTEMRPFAFLEVREGVIYDDGLLRVTALGTRHNRASFAYLVEAEGKRVLFSGDLSTKGPCVDFPVSVLDEPLDLAICECAHFKATEYLPLFEGKATLRRLCFNHYSERHLASVLEMPSLLPDIPVFRAFDGTEITL